MNSKRRTTTRSSSTVDETRSAPRVESTGASILSGASSTSVLGGEIINSQRDHNRATFIINIGGSDSHTSRSTLAVSNPTTSGSIGELPHASISSLLRDSPCSSTSSASNQELNSLEEFSVSTDSGLGGSEPESSEVESPPTEGDLVEEESSNSIYERHMMLKRHGFPLWIPQPNTTLSRSYQRQGVSIGDVGIFTSDGGFDFLFNVCLPAGHPSNPDALPEGFVPLELEPKDVRKFHAHSSHNHLASPFVKRQDRATFECSGSDGAILVMPRGAYHEDLKNVRKFRKYAFIHAESWYVYAKGPCGEEIGNGELHLVTGCDKTTSWGVATYSHLPSKRPEDNVSLLKFNPVRQGHSSYTTYEWDYEGVVDAKFGPEEDELMDLGVDGSVPPRNQCTFIRSLTPAFGKDDWKRLELKVESSVKDQATVRYPKSLFPSVSGAISSLSSRIGFLRGHSRGGSSQVTDSISPAQTIATHPATHVIDMMLRKCPKAKVVVVNDYDWCSVIRASDDDWTYTAQDLPRRIQETFHIVEEKNGTVYLEEKTRQSQDLSTSSDVSVKLEAEDLPLFEDRKPEPSQLFDSFEISPSDMQVDSPWSKKIVDNGDDDIKPNKCHDSSDDDGDEGHTLLRDQKAGPSQLLEISPLSNLKVDSPQTFKKLIDDWDDIKSHKYHDSDEDDEDQSDDEYNLEQDAAFLEFILRRIQQVKNDPSFSRLPPPQPKRLVDDCDENHSYNSSKPRLGIDMVDEDSPWSDAFSEYISLQIQKLKSNSYDNKFKMDRHSSWDPFKANDLDNKHRIMINAIIKIMRHRPKHNISTDNGDDVAKPDLFDASGKADSIFLKGKFVRTDGQLQNQALPNDEDYPMSDAALPEHTSQPHEQEHSKCPPSLPQAVMSPSLDDGPQRKRRKFAKETTDYLKAWLHLHSDHPYPSEDEKTQLCHATGLERKQLSRWMVNARRRILRRAVKGGEMGRTQNSRDPEWLKAKDDQSAVQNIKTEEDPSVFLEQMIELINKAADIERQEYLSWEISESLDMILKGYGPKPGSLDGRSGESGSLDDF